MAPACLRLVVQVLLQLDYVPDRSWLAACQDAMAPCLASPHLRLEQRKQLDDLLRQVNQAVSTGR